MDGKRTSILSDLKRNYGDTKSISKSVDLSALENNANPHQIYNSIFKDVDTTPSDYLFLLFFYFLSVWLYCLY